MVFRNVACSDDKYALRTMPDPALAVAYGERFAALLSAEVHGIAREQLTRFQLRGTKTICRVRRGKSTKRDATTVSEACD
jgi:hypothetical protein